MIYEDDYCKVPSPNNNNNNSSDAAASVKTDLVTIAIGAEMMENVVGQVHSQTLRRSKKETSTIITTTTTYYYLIEK